MTTLPQAAAALRAGDLATAERIARDVVAAQPGGFDGINMLGAVLARQTRWAEALTWLDQAVRLRPAVAPTLNRRGNVLQMLDRHAEALQSYDRALAAQPDFLEALNNRANTLKKLGRLDEALAGYGHAIARKPDYADAWFNRGNALLGAGRLEAALADYEQAARLTPARPDIWNNRGNVLQALQRRDEALKSYEHALSLQSDHVEALNNRGALLHAMGQLTEALADFDRALTAKPDFVDGIANRANTLDQLGRHDEALAAFERALLLDPGNLEVHRNRGITLRSLHRYEEAIASFDRGLALAPDDPAIRFGASLCHLAAGDFARGWPLYEARFQYRKREDLRPVPAPAWDGKSDIAGKSFLVAPEQGFGDQIQFCRYGRMLAERGAEVTFEVEPTLKRLFASLAPAARIVGRDEPLPPVDLQCRILSLPLLLGTTLDSVPWHGAYLAAAPDVAASWRRRIGREGGQQIGVVWSGSARHVNDARRSIGLQAMRRLLERNAAFHGLQTEIRPDDAALMASLPRLQDHAAELRDFAETAGLIANLDLVITVDTSVAHLAGAMGVPVWILLPFAAEWRWMHERNDSPWYPTARIFRQPRRGDWNAVLDQVGQALDSFERPRP